MSQFEIEYEKLSKTDQSIFEEVISNLFLTSYINRTYYDRHAQMFKMNRDFTFIEKNYRLFSDYLSFAGFEIVEDTQAGVIYMTSYNDKTRMRLDLTTTLVIYTLRYIYEEKISSNPTKPEVYVSSNELRQVMMDKGLFSINKRLTASTIASPMRLLAYYNIVNKANGDFLDRTFGFYIMPSIRFVISSAKMNSLVDAINKTLNTEEEEESELI